MSFQPKTEDPESKLRAQLEGFAYTDSNLNDTPSQALRRSSRKPTPRRWAVSDVFSEDEEGGELPQARAAPSSKKRRAKEEKDDMVASSSCSSSKRVKAEEDPGSTRKLRRTPSSTPRKLIKTEDGITAPLKKPKGGYAPPETYAHLSPLPDHILDELDVLFCGFNPGEMSAKTGHHFGNPTNAFWRALHGSGLTAASKALHPSEDGTMPERFSLGLTNLVSRPTNSATELSMAEMRAGAASVLSKTARHRPRVVCYVGNQIADIMYEAVVKSHLVLSKSPIPARVQKRKNAPPRHGLEPYKIMHLEGNVRETLFFIMGSTSGRVANYGMEAKIRAFADLKARVEDAKAGRLDTSAFAVVDTSDLPLLDTSDLPLVNTSGLPKPDDTTKIAVKTEDDSRAGSGALTTDMLAMPTDECKPTAGCTTVSNALDRLANASAASLNNAYATSDVSTANAASGIDLSVEEQFSEVKFNIVKAEEN